MRRRGGGMGPSTVQAIEQILVSIARLAGSLAGERRRRPICAGQRYAERHAELAAAAGVVFERLPPPVGVDWNDTLKGRGG